MPIIHCGSDDITLSYNDHKRTLYIKIVAPEFYFVNIVLGYWENSKYFRQQTGRHAAFLLLFSTLVAFIVTKMLIDFSQHFARLFLTFIYLFSFLTSHFLFLQQQSRHFWLLVTSGLLLIHRQCKLLDDMTPIYTMSTKFSTGNCSIN